MITPSIAIVVGILSWSLAEYVIHRWAGHGPSANSNLFGREHTAHHSRGNYFAAWWKKMITAVVVTAILLGPIIWLLGVRPGLFFIAGFVGFYSFYEVLHRLEHVWKGIGSYGRWARKHHFYHHFHDPKKNFGVTSPLWDHIFGTYHHPETIAVPEKLKMAWLCDPSSGDIWPQLNKHYKLRRRRT